MTGKTTNKFSPEVRAGGSDHDDRTPGQPEVVGVGGHDSMLVMERLLNEGQGIPL